MSSLFGFLGSMLGGGGSGGSQAGSGVPAYYKNLTQNVQAEDSFDQYLMGLGPEHDTNPRFTKAVAGGPQAWSDYWAGAPPTGVQLPYNGQMTTRVTGQGGVTGANSGMAGGGQAKIDPLLQQLFSQQQQQ